MVKYSVNVLDENYDFIVYGVSYIGSPKEHTAMYVSKKVAHLVENLRHLHNCLVFAGTGIEVPDELMRANCFVFSDNPQLAYARFVNGFAEEKHKENIKRKYKLTDGGYYLGENVKIGSNPYIEPGCVIGHDVVIGKDSKIYSGSVIKNAVIGDDFFCNENAVIGSSSFTMYEDEDGNKCRIAALGKVIIGNHVEIGACNNVAVGGCGDTVIEDYVKLDGLIHIGHEAHLQKNAQLTAGIIVAGFADIGENAYIGINSSVRNRISIGSNSIIGMGSNVTRNVEAGKTVVGNPAKNYMKNSGGGIVKENTQCMALGVRHERYRSANI